MESTEADRAKELLARNIRTARGEMRQRDIANHLGLDHMRVSDWERGVCSPSMGNLAALAMLTGKTMAWFYTDHDASAAA